MSFPATWIDLKIITNQSKSERERQISCDITYMWSLKHDTQGKEDICIHTAAELTL